MYPPSVTAAISNLWQERETWLANLYDRLPQTFGHLDAARVNLLSRDLSDGTNEIIAIDWQLSGIGAIGQELSPMIFMSIAMGNVEIDKIHELEKITFEGYVDGLHDAGWQGDVRMAKYGYIAQNTVSNMLRKLGGAMVASIVDEKQHAMWEQMFKRSMSELVEIWSALLRHTVQLSDEGRDLAREVF
jgi:hypothetical protein